MARRPNYRFERVERDRAKAAKRAAKREAKAAKKAAGEPDGTNTEQLDTAVSAEPDANAAEPKSELGETEG